MIKHKHIIRLKGVHLCILFIVALNAYAQSSHTVTMCKDTITVLFSKYEDFKKKIDKEYTSGYYLNDTIFYTTNKRARQNGVTVNKAFTTGKFYNCKDQTKFKYSQFYTKTGNLIAESIWDVEGFQGKYKGYHKNGKLKEEGTYNGDTKINQWSYYDESGKLVKTEKYDEKGSLVQ